jgi:hypothetical protein
MQRFLLLLSGYSAPRLVRGNSERVCIPDCCCFGYVQGSIGYVRGRTIRSTLNDLLKVMFRSPPCSAS